MKPLSLGVLASGRGSNFEAIAKNCAEGKIDAKIAILLSDRKDAKALERAKAFDIEARFVDPGHFKTKLTPEAEEEYVRVLQEHNVELIILAGFMRILKSHFLRSFAGRIINIHPALLPSFPGLHGQKQAFDYGVKVSGCTVHFVDEGVDTGPIIIQRAVPVLEEDTADTLAARILVEEHKIYSEAIQLFAEDRIRINGRRVQVLPKK